MEGFMQITDNSNVRASRPTEETTEDFLTQETRASFEEVQTLQKKVEKHEENLKHALLMTQYRVVAGLMTQMQSACTCCM